jgi:hypothetical protein
VKGRAFARVFALAVAGARAVAVAVAGALAVAVAVAVAGARALPLTEETEVEHLSVSTCAYCGLQRDRYYSGASLVELATSN